MQPSSAAAATAASSTKRKAPVGKDTATDPAEDAGEAGKASGEAVQISVGGLAGGQLASVRLAPSQTVGDLRDAVAAALPQVPASRQRLLFGTRQLADPTELLSTAFPSGAASVEVQVVLVQPVVEFAKEAAFGMSVSAEGRRAEHSGAQLPNGWATVRAKDPLPRGECASWLVVVEKVENCGEAIIGLRHEPSKELPPKAADDYDAFCLMAVGAPSGLVAINRGSHDFGPGTSDRLRFWRRDYAPAISWRHGVGTRIAVSWDGSALRFALNGRDCGVAFSVGAGAEDLPSNGYLYPFVTCYGRGTAVRAGSIDEDLFGS